MHNLIFLNNYVTLAVQKISKRSKIKLHYNSFKKNPVIVRVQVNKYSINIVSYKVTNNLTM